MANILSKAGAASDILTVSQLSALIRGELEARFASVVVSGEISSWMVASSGHAYFSIKDEGALLGCVIWKGSRGRMSFDPREGDKVECRGRVSVFEKRGQYQLLVDGMKRAGEGELWAKFQALKAKLEAEGLFDGARKRPLPLYPTRIGVVTSPTGAVIRDILNILGRRAPFLPVLLWPARVQGEGAAAEISNAVSRLAKSGRVDVIIVGRGGGSAEDLWEFNSEQLARVIHASPVPIISAVGHETDFSISDFVADLRAPTPSAAAELASAGYVDLRERLLDRVARARRVVESHLKSERARVTGLLQSHALRRPELLLREYQQRVDLAMKRMPEVVLRRLERARARVERLDGALDGHNPELILSKGYAIVRRASNERVISSADELKKNLPISLQFKDGRRQAVVSDDSAPDLFG